MSRQIQKFINLLKSQVGYSAQGGGYTKFGHWYGNTVEFDSDYSAQPWCDMFLSWGARQLGYQKWVGQFAYTPDHAKWFQSNNAWGQVPKQGALVFYDWGGSKSLDNIDHVGIVTSVEGSMIHTIEGNIDGGLVREKVRDQSNVVGYGYPDQVRAKQQLTVTAAAAPGHSTLSVAPVAAAEDLPAPGSPLLVVPVLLAALALFVRVRTRRLRVRIADTTGDPARFATLRRRD